MLLFIQWMQLIYIITDHIYQMMKVLKNREGEIMSDNRQMGLGIQEEQRVKCVKVIGNIIVVTVKGAGSKRGV